MKITLNQEQINFLKRITKNTEYEKDILAFTEDIALEVDEDLADELRELCAEYEVDNAQINPDQSLYGDGKTAYELVNLLYS